MDPIMMILIGGGIYLATRKPKKKKKRTNLPPGHYELDVNEELSLLMPRDTGYWTETGIGGTPGDVDVFNAKGDPLNLGRVRGSIPGPLKVQYYANPEKTDLVAEYSFQVRGATSQRGVQTASLARG